MGVVRAFVPDIKFCPCAICIFKRNVDSAVNSLHSPYYDMAFGLKVKREHINGPTVREFGQVRHPQTKTSFVVLMGARLETGKSLRFD